MYKVVAVVAFTAGSDLYYLQSWKTGVRRFDTRMTSSMPGVARTPYTRLPQRGPYKCLPLNNLKKNH